MIERQTENGAFEMPGIRNGEAKGAVTEPGRETQGGKRARKGGAVQIAGDNAVRGTRFGEKRGPGGNSIPPPGIVIRCNGGSGVNSEDGYALAGD